MANNIVLKTYRGGSVTPLDDAIIQQTVIATNGIFKGCNVTYARGNVLHVSQGFGMIKGRFFEVYDCEVGVILNSGSGTLQGGSTSTWTCPTRTSRSRFSPRRPRC